MSLDAYVEELAMSTLGVGTAVTLKSADCPYSFNSIRAALSRQRLPVRTHLTGDALIIVPKPANMTPGRSGPSQSLENRLESKLVNLSILGAVRILLNHCILESYTVLGKSLTDLNQEYPELSDWFETVETERGVILL